MCSPVILARHRLEWGDRATDWELQIVVVFGSDYLYRVAGFLENFEYTERTNRDGAAARLSLSMRPRVAPTRQGRKAARLSEVQEPAVGRTEGRAEISAGFWRGFSPFENEPWEIDECVKH